MGFSVVIAVSGADPFHLSTDRRAPSGAGPDTHEAAHLRIGRRQSPASRILPSGRRRFPLLKALRNARSSPKITGSERMSAFSSSALRTALCSGFPLHRKLLRMHSAESSLR